MSLYGFFESLVPPFPEHEIKMPPRGVVAFCRYYARGLEGYLLALAVLSALIAVLEVALFGFMGQLVDWFGIYTPTTLLPEKGGQMLLMLAVVLLLLPAAVFLHSLVLRQTLLGNFPMSIRWLAHRYLLKQSVSFYHNEFAGRIATKVMQTSLAVRELVMKLLDIMVYVCVYFLSLLFLVAQSDWRLGLPLLVWLGVYLSMLRYFLPRLAAVAREQANARSEMTGRVVDSYTNISTVKLFSHTSRESEYARESMGRFLTTVHPQMRLVSTLNISVFLNNVVLVCLIAGMAVWLWSFSLVTGGAIAIAVSLSLRLNGMSQWIMWEVSNLFESIGTVHDGMATLAQPLAVEDEPHAPELVVAKGAIDFHKVKFSYNDERPIFENLDLSIAGGEKVGLVGRSGAGKSTLVNLLLRFYDAQGGNVSIDGQSIRSVAQQSLRSQIGMVTQDTSLLHRSVGENIAYGAEGVTDADILAACESAEAAEFISDLEDVKGRRGLDAMVGERGVNLSGGQRQRIAIARVMLKNAPILVLDEATSALDSEAELAIQKSLNRLMENKTVIAIAHRLSTIAAMDRLIVLDQGRVVETGSHQQLLEQGGIYASLWAHQSGGFIGVD